MGRPRKNRRANARVTLPYANFRHTIRYCKLTGLWNAPAALTSKIAAKIAVHEEMYELPVVMWICGEQCPRKYFRACNDPDIIADSSLEMERFAARLKARKR